MMTRLKKLRGSRKTCCWVQWGLGLWLCLASMQILGHESRAENEKATLMLRRLLGQLYTIELMVGSSSGSAESPQLVAHAEEALAVYTGIRPRLAPERGEALQGQLQMLKGLCQARVSEGKAHAPAGEALERHLRALREELWRIFQVEPSPAEPPDRALAERAYAAHCTSCHGAKGAGDGVLAAKIPRKMPNFQDPQWGAAVGPLMVLNFLLEGVPQSPMPAFKEQLTQAELWSLSYYLLTFSVPERPGSPAGKEPPLRPADRAQLVRRGLSLSLLAKSNNRQLEAWLSSTEAGQSQLRGLPSAPLTGEDPIAYLRNTMTFGEKLPR